MPVRLSRRAFLAAAGGGGLVAAASATAIWRSRRPTSPPHDTRKAAEPLVDQEGWIVTAADKKKVPGDQLAGETQ